MPIPYITGKVKPLEAGTVGKVENGQQQEQHQFDISATTPIDPVKKTSMIRTDYYQGAVIRGSNFSTNKAAYIQAQSGKKPFLDAAHAHYMADETHKLVGLTLAMADGCGGHSDDNQDRVIGAVANEIVKAAVTYMDKTLSADFLKIRLSETDTLNDQDHILGIINDAVQQNVPNAQKESASASFLVAKTFPHPSEPAKNILVGFGLGDSAMGVWDPLKQKFSTPIASKQTGGGNAGIPYQTYKKTDLCVVQEEIADGAILIPMTDGILDFLPTVTTKNEKTGEATTVIDPEKITPILADLGKDTTPEDCAKALTQFAFGVADELRQLVLLDERFQKRVKSETVYLSQKEDEGDLLAIEKNCFNALNKENAPYFMRLSEAQRRGLVQIATTNQLGDEATISAYRVPVKLWERHAAIQSGSAAHKAVQAARSLMHWNIAAAIIGFPLIVPVVLLFVTVPAYRKAKANFEANNAWLTSEEPKEMTKYDNYRQTYGNFIRDQLGSRGANPALPQDVAFTPTTIMARPDAVDSARSSISLNSKVDGSLNSSRNSTSTEESIDPKKGMAPTKALKASPT